MDRLKMYFLLDMGYTLENWHGTWKSPVWKGKSSSKPPFLGYMLIFRGVFHSYDSLAKGTQKKSWKKVWPISKNSIMTSIVVHQRKPVCVCWNAGSSTSLLIPRDSNTYPTFYSMTLTTSTSTSSPSSSNSYPFHSLIIIPYPLHLASAFFHLDPISCGRSFNGWNAGFGASSITPKWKPSSSSSEPSPGQKPSNILGPKGFCHIKHCRGTICGSVYGVFVDVWTIYDMQHWIYINSLNPQWTGISPLFKPALKKSKGKMEFNHMWRPEPPKS